MTGRMTPEQERVAREMFPPTHPAVVVAAKKVVAGSLGNPEPNQYPKARK